MSNRESDNTHPPMPQSPSSTYPRPQYQNLYPGWNDRALYTNSQAYTPPAQYSSFQTSSESQDPPLPHSLAAQSPDTPSRQSYRYTPRSPRGVAILDSPLSSGPQSTSPLPPNPMPSGVVNLNLQMKPHNGRFSAIQRITDLIDLDATVTIPTNNMAIVHPVPVTWDGYWYKHIASVPLDFGQGYLLDEQPTVEAVTPGVPCMFDDHNGPPEQFSGLHKWWIKTDPDISEIQQSEWMSLDDLSTCYSMHELCQKDHLERSYGNRGCFLLPKTVRENLYNRLFTKIRFDVGANEYIGDIVESKVLAILRIENFLLSMLCVFAYYKITRFPNMKTFIHDFFDIIESLVGKEDHPTRIKVSEMSTEIKLDQVTWWSEKPEFTQSWEERWTKHWSTIDTTQCVYLLHRYTKRNYICGVFDAIFGLWPAPGHCLLHYGYDNNILKKIGSLPSERDLRRPKEDLPPIHPLNPSETAGHWALTHETIPRCIHSGLYFWEDPPPQPEVGSDDKTQDDVTNEASISLVAMDALLVERRLPYTFQATDCLDKHLTILSGEKEKILIFTDWTRFLMLRHHKILVHDSRRDYPEDEVSRFQLLSRSTRSAIDRINDQGGDVRYIAYELLLTYSLLFYHQVSDSGGEFHRDTRITFGGRSYPWFCNGYRKSSQEIAEKISLNPTHGFSQLIEILRHPDRSVPQSADFKIFRKRLEGLSKEFSAWKPSRFSELFLWRGWVEEEVGYWGWIVTVIGIPFVIISLGVSIVSMVFSIIK
jgi:hypothetical protein